MLFCDAVAVVVARWEAGTTRSANQPIRSVRGACDCVILRVYIPLCYFTCRTCEEDAVF